MSFRNLLRIIIITNAHAQLQAQLQAYQEAQSRTWPTSGTVTDNTVVWTKAGTGLPTAYDYFTLVSADPELPTNTVTMTINQAQVNNISINNLPNSPVILLADGATIRTYNYVLSSAPAGPEIALHAMGDLNSADGYLVAFEDLAIQILGIQ